MSNPLVELIVGWLDADQMSRECFYDMIFNFDNYPHQKHDYTKEQIEEQIYKLLLGGQIVEYVSCCRKDGSWGALVAMEFYPNTCKHVRECNKEIMPNYKDEYYRRLDIKE